MSNVIFLLRNYVCACVFILVFLLLLNQTWTRPGIKICYALFLKFWLYIIGSWLFIRVFLYIKFSKKCQILPPFSGFPPFIHNPTPIIYNRHFCFRPDYIKRFFLYNQVLIGTRLNIIWVRLYIIQPWLLKLNFGPLFPFFPSFIHSPTLIIYNKRFLPRIIYK
jgi:hypothetical protein